MAGNKTHKQQIRIIQERVNTKNGGEDFNAEEDLKRSDEDEDLRHGEPKPRGDIVGERDR